MRAVRLAAAALGALALAAPAQSAVHGPVPVAPSLRPEGLKAFLLRAGETAAHTFPRTPSFAWQPVSGALRYEFELATSRNFSENGTVWTETTKTPVAAVPIALPWITGAPYSLYAHVRAITRRGTTEWSVPYGFNVRWNSLPTPLSTYPGVVRWTPVAGANRYQVWFVDPGTAGQQSCPSCSKIVNTQTNVADEREYYSFHQGAGWAATVHWRVRALRAIYGSLQNGLPAVSYGPWSPIYTSSNPPFAVGPLTAIGTLSDTLSNALQASKHALMPAFLFSGNQSIWGFPEDLYRVYVFTDQDCLNMVFESAVVGSPAYAPRLTGPLGLPQDGAALVGAHANYLPDGGEGSSYMADGTPIKATESVVTSNPGGSSSPKVDLWDNDWPSSRYYWTVVPVDAIAAQTALTTLTGSAAAGGTTLTVADASGFAANDSLLVGSPGPSQEEVSVKSITGNVLTLSTGVANFHSAGEPVQKPTGAVQYYDAELPQEACASGRMLTFGKTSTPTVTSSQGPYASGLTPYGQLSGAAKAKPLFYGTPLVAWQPAIGADQYEIQWSHKAYPWQTVGKQVTYSTSAALPLSPGTWYYRVRGINFLLPGTKQQMSWSDPAALVVTRARYRVVR